MWVSKKSLVAGLLVGFSLGGMRVASADSVTFNSVKDETDMHFSLTLGAQNYNEYVAVGVYSWTGNAANTVLPTSQFNTFCIDFVNDINYNVTYTDYALGGLQTAPVGLPNIKQMSSQQADAIRELWGLNYYGLGVDTPSADAAKIAGFQMAIWEILYESPGASTLSPANLSLTSGNFKTTDSNSAVTYASDYLASIFDSSGALKTGNLSPYLNAMTSNTYQDQMLYIPTTTMPFQSIPLPLPTAALGGGTLMSTFGILAAIRRRRAAEL